MKLRLILLALVSVITGTFFVSNSSLATSATYSDTGTLTTNGTWANTLTFTDPNVTATFDVTNTDYKALATDDHCMRTDACDWWGVDGADGFYCGDLATNANAACRATSLTNSALAFSPSAVADTKGVTWSWKADPLCGVRYPKPSDPNIVCSNVSTVAIQFSAPVSNAIIHLANIGGNGNRITYRSDDFSRGFDWTLYSKWKLTSGQRIEMLSGESTTNITLDGSTIRSKHIPQGVGARPGVGECPYNSQTCRNKNGTGSGSFLIHGTYSAITFDIDLGFSLVNYGWNETPTDALVDSIGNTNNQLVEGVSVQMSFYKSGPALPTTTTTALPTPTTVASAAAAPSSTAAPTPTAAPTSTSAPRRTARSSNAERNLPETGTSGEGGALIAMLLMSIGGFVVFHARRRNLR
jgi:LPXTG-motif cell wall-anchored protein